ncbi:MAG TPA: aminotransferase class I/II-fold pyridoxal phosphate-dependent enzyme, partial [Nitriliruptoraceae bacterium]|nr:aminotransferase class I/II-fold pyridoxal phosphate-dependent enzyme [Nitriliruptoraceae bacterium]
MTSTTALHTLTTRHAAFADRKLGLDLTRGKPNSEQLALSESLDGILDGDFHDAHGTDLRNYGGTVAGIAELGSWLMDVPPANVLAGGNASLELMWHVVSLLHQFGIDGPESAWRHRAAPRILCPVPGYDRHFALTERMGIEMVPVPMTDDGPDMDVVEELVATDPDVVGMWCVPKYSNPTGVVFSADVVDRIARLGRRAGPHFRVLWDNAYAVHDLTDRPPVLSPIWQACMRHDTLDSIIHFASTSKITLAGGGVAFVGASAANL